MQIALLVILSLALATLLWRWLTEVRDLKARLRQSQTELAEVRIPILDRPGAAAEIFTLAAELGVNVASFEVVHSVEGDRGIMVLVVRAEHVDMFRGGLLARGFRPAVQKLT